MSLRHCITALAAAGSGLLVTASLSACPSCPTARAVQASVFDERFWLHLGFTALPLGVLALIVARLYRISMSTSREGDEI
jgi:hypothetical protein